MNALSYRVKRGAATGTVLTPHCYSDGSFIVSRTRFVQDQIRVSDEKAVLGWIQKGYGLRMSNPRAPGAKAPSLISANTLLKQV
jgi:hypothetical protein